MISALCRCGLLVGVGGVGDEDEVAVLQKLLVTAMTHCNNGLPPVLKYLTCWFEDKHNCTVFFVIRQ